MLFFRSRPVPPRFPAFILYAVLPLSGPVSAAEWSVAPRLTVSEAYSDNITLAPPGQEEDDLISEISPGMRITGEGPGANVNLDYQYQSLFYADHSDRDQHYQQLSADGDMEIVDDSLFLEGWARLAQVNVDTRGPLPRDNLTITGNRSDLASYEVSPYFLHDFGGYVETELRYRYSDVDFDFGASDSVSEEYLARFEGGRRFTRLTWDFSYHKEDLERRSAPDAAFESARLFAGYDLTRDFSGLIEIGYEDNEFQTNRKIENGSYAAAGLRWSPGRILSLELLGGDDFRRASITLRPTVRTSLSTTWREQEVGTNPGTAWFASFNHRARRSEWGISYNEVTETIQQQVAQFEPLRDEEGNIITVTDAEGRVLVPGEIVLSLTDGVYLSKRTRGFLAHHTGKSDIRMSVFKEIRDFETIEGENRVLGSHLGWTWRFARRMKSVLFGSWRNEEFIGSPREDRLRDAGLRLVRQLNRSTEASIELEHTERTSTQAVNEYKENHVLARVKFTF